MDLREEYKKFQQEKEKNIDDAAISWIKENVIFINEQIDPKTINLLNNKITRFDRTFGKFKEKIPALAQKLTEVEDEMQAYLTGTISDKRASELLEKLGYLYNSISTFLNSSLKVLLRTSLFRAAKEFGDVKVNVLDAPGHNASIIRDAFINALKPSNDDAMLLRKLYRGKRVPMLDAKLIATQLLNLSFNELEELTGIEKIPMITAEPLSTSPQMPAPAESNTTTAPLQIATEEKTLIAEEQLNEVNLDLLQKVQTYNKAISVLKKSPNLNKMPNLQKTVMDVDKKINSVLTSKGSSLFNKVQSIWGGDMDSQLMKLTQYLNAFVNVWNAVKEKYNLDLNDSQTILAMNPDKTINSMVKKIIDDKNLSKDFMEQTPADLESFSNSLNQYFDEIKKTGVATNQSAQPEAPQASPQTEIQPTTSSAQSKQQASTAPKTEMASSEDPAEMADEVSVALAFKEPSRQALNKQFQKMYDAGFRVVKK